MYICIDPNSDYATKGDTIEDAYEEMLELNCSSDPIDNYQFMSIPDDTVFEYYTTKIIKKTTTPQESIPQQQS